MRDTTKSALRSLVATLVVLAVCSWYLLDEVLESGGGNAVSVSVRLPRTGGLFEGSGVSYRGVVVGKVTHIALDDDGIVATAVITSDTRVPRDSEVRVRTLSAVGEQYLDFAPRVDDGPFLTQGDVVVAQAGDVPLSVGEVALSLDRLASQFDPEQVGRVLDELSVGLDRASDDLQSLFRSGARVAETAEDNLALIRTFLTSGRTVLALGVQAENDIRRATSSFSTFARWLRRFDPELFSILAATPSDLERLRRLVMDLSAVLPDYLDAQSDVDDILTSHDPHLRELLQAFPAGLDAFASSMRENRVNFDLLLRRGPTCDYGVRERSPFDVSYRELLTRGHCPTDAQDYSQRGAQFAPGPIDTP